MISQVLVVTMERLMRSPRMSQARSLVPESPVIRVATIRPEETGILTAGSSNTGMTLPINRNRKVFY